MEAAKKEGAALNLARLWFDAASNHSHTDGQEVHATGGTPPRAFPTARQLPADAEIVVLRRHALARVAVQDVEHVVFPLGWDGDGRGNAIGRAQRSEDLTHVVGQGADAERHPGEGLKRLATGDQEEKRNGNRADPAAGIDPAFKRYRNEPPADRLGPEPLWIAEHEILLRTHVS